ncbi:MAG: PDZ domain-containing protein [Nitrospiraceae bacterium]|nr:MAG: PDZ domain-containing protein [Nitrospiraceae bacterium]
MTGPFQKIILFIIISLLPPLVAAAYPAPGYDLEVNINIAASEVKGLARIEVIEPGKTLLVRKGGLLINYLKLNGKQTGFNEDFGALKIIPDEKGILEIGYRARFRDNHEHGINAGTGGNVIDSRGVSLTSSWYPEVEGLHNYSLKVTLPKGYEAVSEAEEIKKISHDNATEFYFDFPHALDNINLTASDRYSVKKAVYGDVEVFVYFFTEDAYLSDSYIEFTKKYLQMYEGLLGKFPYKRFSVVENFLPTGYSFPTFTLLGNMIVRMPFIVETSLGHEILHQWFGNYVYVDYEKGNWAEGLTTYLADHLYEEQKNKGWEYRKQILTDYKSYVTAENEFPVKGFRGRVDPSTRAIGYGKAAMVFHMLKKTGGENAFFNALKDVVKKNPFRPVSWDDLKESFEMSYGQDLSWFFRQWVDDTGLPEISVDDLEAARSGSGYALSFTVDQKGKVFRLALPMTVYSNNAAVSELLVVDREKNSFEFSFPERPDRIVFDEDYDVARELGPREFPPVLARLFGEKNLLLVNPPEKEEIYGSIIRVFNRSGAVEKDAGDIKNSDIKSSSVLIFGADNPLSGRIFGKGPSEAAGFFVIVRENPLNPDNVIGIISGKSKAEADAASGKIGHYGKYSKLLFDNGRNIGKEIGQTGRGIIMDMEEETPAVDVSTIRKLREIIDGVADKTIIYVGEEHDSFAHHAVQLDVIRGLHRKNKKIAIGMEMFQRPFQKALDRYIAGETDEPDFLKESEYFKRWGFDYNLYKPVLDFARAEKIPLIALNQRREISKKVSVEGLDSLTAGEKAEIPLHIDFSDGAYRGRLKKIFGQHKNSGDKNFDYFYQAQLLWDETMSWSIDEFLGKTPGHQVVVLAGRGHIEFGSGIPKRTFRRNNKDYAIILSDVSVEPGIADYVVFPKPVEGKTSPKLMIMISEEKEGLRITGFAENSVSEKAGLKAGDIILTTDGTEIRGLDDLKIHLFYRKTGDTVKVEVLRKEGNEEKKIVFDVTL